MSEQLLAPWDGDILMSATGGSGSNSIGILSWNSAQILSTGIGASAGTIALNGTGGNGGQGHGVDVSNYSLISSSDGAIAITGVGGNTGNSNLRH